ncbi:hypothetical protein pb186bvf_002944 [Paramecium bursaria]
MIVKNIFYLKRINNQQSTILLKLIIFLFQLFYKSATCRDNVFELYELQNL